jgi:hypothetical protein
VVDPAPVGGASQPRLELVRGEVERSERVGGSRLGPDDRSAGQAGELDARTLSGEARVVLLADLDVDSMHLAVELGHLGELGLDVCPEALADLGVPTLHDDVHAVTSVDAHALMVCPPREPAPWSFWLTPRLTPAE